MNTKNSIKTLDKLLKYRAKAYGCKMSSRALLLLIDSVSDSDNGDHADLMDEEREGFEELMDQLMEAASQYGLVPAKQKDIAELEKKIFAAEAKAVKVLEFEGLPAVNAAAVKTPAAKKLRTRDSYKTWQSHAEKLLKCKTPKEVLQLIDNILDNRSAYHSHTTSEHYKESLEQLAKDMRLDAMTLEIKQ